MMDISKYMPAAEQLDQQTGSFDAIPEGFYSARIDELKLEDSKFPEAGQQYLAVTWTIIGPRFANRKMFQNLKLWHTQSDQALKAWKILDIMARACGHTRDQVAKNTGILLGKVCSIEVGVWSKDGTGEQKNNVRKIVVDKPTAVPKPAFGKPAAQPAAESKTSPGPAPWARRAAPAPAAPAPGVADDDIPF